jgi:hypothetical protein
MSVLSAVADGCQRVLRAPVLVIGVWFVYVFVPGPVLVDARDAYVALIDATAVDPVPALLTVFWNTSSSLAFEMMAAYLVATFLLGGILDRLARNRATASYGFFGACGMFFFRFIRLAPIAIAVYAVLFRIVYPALPNAPIPRDVILMALLIVVHGLFDFAKVRMVVEDRRSAIGGVVAALRFIRRNLVAALSLATANALLAAATWWLAASFAIGATAAVYAYWLARALLRLIFAASEISLFQSRLAHAGYTARPLPTWPDSPAAEAVLPQ